MNPGSFVSVVEPLADDALAVPVGIKIDSSCRNDTGKVGTESFEESTPALKLVYREENLESFGEMQSATLKIPELSWRWDAPGFPGSGDLTLVEIRLQPSLEHIKRRGKSGRGHATDTAQYQQAGTHPLRRWKVLTLLPGNVPMASV